MTSPNLVSRFRSLSPHGALLGGIVAGVVLVLLSFLANAASVVRDHEGITRQVGYAAAPNWGLTFTLAFPLFLYFVLSAMRSTERAFPDLERMLVDDDGVPVPDADDALRRRYRKLLGRTDRISLALAATALGGSLIEWYVYSFRPLFLGGAVPEGEVDWSVAAAAGSMGERVLNATFSFLAFTAQGLYIGVIVAFLVFVYVFADLVRQLADSSTPPMLVPDVNSTDPRRGFQRLGRVVEELLVACSCAFLVFWLSRLQNLYLASKTTAASLWEFFREDVSVAVTEMDVTAFGRALVDTGGIEFSTVMVSIGAFALLIASIAIPLHTLRRAAVDAKMTALNLASARPRTFAKHLTDAELKASIDGMAVWPMSYPQLNHLLFWVAFAVLSLIFYRIGTAFVLLWMWRIVQKAFRAGKPQAAPAPAATT
jgi:hypothetical protein